MRIAYATQHDPYDIHGFSGIGYHMMKALMHQPLDVQPIGPLTRPALGYLEVIRSLNEQVTRKLRGVKADVVFSSGFDHVCCLEGDRPVVFWHDAMFATVRSYYSPLQDDPAELREAIAAVDRMALQNCRLAIFASDWAARDALSRYDVDGSKVKVVPFGANLEGRRRPDELGALVASRPTDRCKLLFVGYAWRRKGGDVVLKIAEELNRQGLRTELTVVGCEPEIEGPAPDYVKTLGFVSKATPEGLGTMERLFGESHFLVVPSRAECFGIVFAEASAHGLPSIATLTGGIPTAVRDDVNGKLFRPGAHVSEYCAYVSDLMSDRRRYEELSLSAFNEFRTRLDWNVGAATVKTLMEEYCV